MGLNIKNPRTHALVRELAERTGQSQTSAVEEAVLRYLDELKRPGDYERRAAETKRIVAEIHRTTSPEQIASLTNAETELYDELGLPR